MHLQENTLFAFDEMFPSTLYISCGQYAPAKFEVATSKGLGGDALTEKYII